MAHEAGIETRGGVWKELALTLRRLEAFALRPADELGADSARELQRLQYSLHQLGGRIVGLRLPAAAAAAQAELAESLADARDATAELAAAMWAEGAAGAAPLVYEWRGALFRVRLARMVLAPARPRGRCRVRLGCRRGGLADLDRGHDRGRSRPSRLPAVTRAGVGSLAL